MVEPGHPEKSWLYLLVTNTAAAAGCVTTNGVSCLTDSMPYGGGVTVTSTQADAIKKWITDGAVAPK